MSPSKPFERYSWLSVQLDQYFAAIRIFSFHYDRLKTVYEHIPEQLPDDIHSWPEPAKAFFMMATTVLNTMGTTQIFSEVPFPQLNALPEDMQRIGFDTCFAFQWTLFENFVKQRVLSLVDGKVLALDVCKELKRRERRTEEFFRYIESGKVFGDSPFTTILPLPGWLLQFENCDFSDLDKIRRIRNQLVHAANSAPGSVDRSDRHYERSMWILRMFAGNVDQTVTAVQQRKENED